MSSRAATLPLTLTSPLPSAAPLPPWRPDPGDGIRQALLARSDAILDELERLRLRECRLTPDEVRSRVAALRSEAGLPARRVPRSVGAANDLILSMQEHWLALNPRHPGTGAPPPLQRGAGPGDGDGGSWRHLMLPSIPEGGADDAWRNLARATVERAFDRWCWAQHHATRAARETGDGATALDRASAAWSNYFALQQDAARLGAWRA
ncbi:MAG: hypothetical protein ACREQM_01905 [Candidatus Dormibacteraceae bacterium]